MQSLPLVDGPYLRSEGHDGLIRIYDPDCVHNGGPDAPIVMDFRNEPTRADNIATYPTPWINRADAMFAYAKKIKDASPIVAGHIMDDRVGVYRLLAAADPIHNDDLAQAKQDLTQFI